VRVLLAMGLCWAIILALRLNDPIWALISVIMVTDPDPVAAARLARARLLNTMAGVVIGLACLLSCGAQPWVVFLGVAVAILVGSRQVDSPAKIRLALITVVLVLGTGAVRHSTAAAVEAALRRAGEVLLGCVVPVLLAWLLDKLRRAPVDQSSPDVAGDEE
jgi:uncharacterized membrane protein YccC